MGKSALAQQFLDELQEGYGAIVLRGRVFERESVPYKAFDGVIDALTRHLLRREEPAKAGATDGLWALARLFPVLRAVPFVAGVPDPGSADPGEVRREALRALRALLGQLSCSGTAPVVVCIEDAHWGDVDSAPLVLEVLRSGAFLLLTWQADLAAQSAFLRTFRAQGSVDAELRELPLGPLRPDDARALALALLDSPSDDSTTRAEAIARESAGSPFLIEELVRSVSIKDRRTAPDRRAADPEVTSLEGMVAEQLAHLDDPSRKLLEVVSVAGHPIDLDIAAKIAGIEQGIDGAVAPLQARRIARVGLRGGREVIEVTHGLLASTVVSRLDDDVVRAEHARLASLLEHARTVDAEAVAAHFFSAGDASRGAEWAERAADESAAKLAFDQAARLYRLAIGTLEALGEDPARIAALRLRLGEADARLSSDDLEGALKGRVDDLLRMQRDIDEQERLLADLRARCDPGAGGDDEAAVEVRLLEDRLQTMRSRFQDAVVDLPVDDGDGPGER
jgi:hypothetical protein